MQTGVAMETGKDVRVLVVEDNAGDLARALDALRWCGLGGAVRVARGGQEALDLLFGRGQFHNRRRFPLPDLLLLDLNMPAVDGHCVMRAIKQSEELRRIPVLALCMSEHEGHRAMSCPSRPNDFLVKPVTRESLADLPWRLRNWTLRLDMPDAFGDDDDGMPPTPPRGGMQAASQR